ncbi:glutathione peroxidase 9 [Latimeria chalumnae]|uniref:glutathione peroxidase 9 n=1 Tax=Latimeria chalumnae TaxID=7897 RepID=UPI0003C19362
MQYHQLNALMETFADTAFAILAFPCNQFGLQEPEDNQETINVLKYVRPGEGFVPKFQVFSKIEVNGATEHPLYTFLKESCPFVNPLIGNPRQLYWTPLKVNDIRWNFEKFLIDSNGIPYKRYDMRTPFDAIKEDIVTLLKSGS